MTRHLLPLLFSLELILIANTGAAISVSGISDESNYTGARSFTVADPAGFTTTATLNGEAIPVGTSVSAGSAGFYELVVSETPEGGGAADEQTFLFNIREPGRGSTETGLPAFTAAPLVNDAPSAVNTGMLELIAPVAFPDDLPVPVIALLEKSNGDPLWLNTQVRIANQPANTIQLRRGFGYTFLAAQGANTTINASTADLNAANPISIEDNTITYTPVSGDIMEDINFGDNARLEITSDLTIDATATVTIGAGGIVRVAAGVDIHVDGTFIVDATTANPTTFAPDTPGSPWGGFLLEGTVSDVTITGAIFHGHGADLDWFDGSGYSVHRDEQALFLVGNSDADLQLTDCYLIESPGQFLHNTSGNITLDRCLLQGAPTAGQLNGGTVNIDRSALLLFPTDDPAWADGDNDALYLTSGTHNLSNTVIGYTQDDGLDTGGSPSGYTAATTAQSCWFESILHEAMSSSGEKDVIAEDTVFFNCGQTVECGYDGPRSKILSCLSVANMVGARFGDNYDWSYSGSELSVTDSLLLNSLYHDIWGYDWASWSYNFEDMTVAGNKMTIAQDLARHPAGNSLFDPVADAPLIAPYMPVPGSEVGIAITGTPSQGAIAEYPQTFTVQLSTFSSNVVSTGYSLTGKTSPDGPEIQLANGSLTFNPGETKKPLALPLPPAESFVLLRLALESPVNAADTGGEAWFLDTQVAPTPTLIARGSIWQYEAQRAEPAAGWNGQAFDASNWQSGPMPIGYGDDDVVTELTAAEQGPNGDRTTAVYFRREFQVADASVISSLTLNLQRDDGAIVYLNGVEIARSNMDAGAVSYSTLASGSAGSASEEDIYYEIPLPAAALTNLQTGSNVLAVEVHQSSLGSSDLSIDLDLIAETSDRQVDLIRLGSAAYLVWSDPAAILQESDDLLDWESSDAQSPFLILTDEARKFYRILFP